MANKRRTQAERRAETQASMLASACRLFGERGYEDTALEDIAKDCGLTIRPVYHYYGNKKQLFAAVTEVMEQRLVDALKRTKADSLLTGLTQGWETFLKVAQDPAFRQIVLIDSPHILGRQRWNENAVIDTARTLLMQYQPDLAEDEGEILLRMIIAALSEAALMMAEQPELTNRSAKVINRLVSFLEV